MNPQTFHEHIKRYRRLAQTTLALDEELGTHHGIGWADLVLLELLQAKGDQLTTTQAAACQGLTPTRLLLQLLPMEKLGLLQRAHHPDGARVLALTPAGERVLNEARYTAEAILDLAH